LGRQKRHKTLFSLRAVKEPLIPSIRPNLLGTYEFGSEHLKETYLKLAIVGDMVTEPGAGSDVGGLRTRAKRDGDFTSSTASRPLLPMVSKLISWSP